MTFTGSAGPEMHLHGLGKKPFMKADLAIYRHMFGVSRQCWSVALMLSCLLDFSSCAIRNGFSKSIHICVLSCMLFYTHVAIMLYTCTYILSVHSCTSMYTVFIPVHFCTPMYSYIHLPCTLVNLCTLSSPLNLCLFMFIYVTLAYTLLMYFIIQCIFH